MVKHQGCDTSAVLPNAALLAISLSNKQTDSVWFQKHNVSLIDPRRFSTDYGSFIHSMGQYILHGVPAADTDSLVELRVSTSTFAQLDGCTNLPSQAVDGSLFHVKHHIKSFVKQVFRLEEHRPGIKQSMGLCWQHPPPDRLTRIQTQGDTVTRVTFIGTDSGTPGLEGATSPSFPAQMLSFLCSG